MTSKISRRDFLKGAWAALGAAATGQPLLSTLGFVTEVDNPLDVYPNRDWEKIYRNQFRYDSYFHFLCAPNDTHNCLLRAYVKNGVVTRIGPSYGYGKAEDLYGHRASHRWDPRVCQKGLALVRRIYGPRRVQYPMVREGFKKWAEAGFPRNADATVDPIYLQRGKEPFIRVTHEEAYELVAKALLNVVTTYTGADGATRLKAQGYDEAMIQAMHGAGTQVVKVRGGMPLLGATRIFGMNRFSNSLALLDAKVRGVPPEQALGGRTLDSYSWHTDLPPGHPMTCGQQTIDFDLATAENAELIVCWGMNWISTKMPDGHWLTEARLKGTKVVTVACEYQSTSNKADAVIVIRPGSDPAFALGLVHVILRERLYDLEYVKAFTDLPLLVRMDTLKLLRPQDFIPGYVPANLKNIQVLNPGQKAPPPVAQTGQITTAELRAEWGDFAAWDTAAARPRVVTRDDAGSSGPFALEGSFEVQTVDGQRVTVRPVFDLAKEHVSHFTPETTGKICHTDPAAIEWLAKAIARHKGSTLVAVGMGPNHFFNNDLKDRAIFLLCALTRNIGFFGGNIGSFAGNYRGAYFNGLPFYVMEDPFDIELDPAKSPRLRSCGKYESAHYYNYGDRPLRVGTKLFTGKTHLPTPTKFLWFSNSNSILGNLKGHHQFVVHTLPRIDCVVVNEWWWSASCEYADIVLAVDSWAEFRYPDMTAAVTNPFFQVFPTSPLPRLYDTRGDIETLAGVGSALARLTGEPRFADYWKFVSEGRVEVYLQRIIDHSTTLKGYRIEDVHAKAKQGIPALLLTRTYPKIMGFEQSNEKAPHYTRSGRLEFYRDEPEFLEHGENLPVHREPVEGTFYQPNVIVCGAEGLIRPLGPEAYGLRRDDLSVESRQVRNVVVKPAELLHTQHPRRKDGFSLVYITPKYRHSAHTTPVDIDLMSVWFGPFGDVYRRDKRMPWVGEGYVDLNPLDARELGLEDGDYVYIDGDPADLPFKDWQQKPDDYKVHRAMMRVRYNLGLPRGVARSWFNMYVATYGSVEAHQTRPDKLARNPRTGYQAMFRSGSHQSVTRAWLRPTLMTDSLVRKGMFGQEIGKGFAPDIHCTTGAPKEAFVKAVKAEPGGVDHALWRPAQLGFRPGYESPAMKMFLKGGFIC
jgi:nitrate reductase alpha subunit